MNTSITTRNPAWMTLGHTLTNDVMTADDALTAANMKGWNVRKEAMTTASGIEVPNRVATVRTDPTTGDTRYLGYVGHGYVIQQNEETFGFLDDIVDVSGAHYDTAGYLKDGARVFTSLKLPEGIRIAGEDAVDLYLLATNGHDGFTPFTIAVTPIRLACTNQLTMALRTARQSWKIRHTTHMAGRVAEARESLALTFEYVDAFTAEMEMLLDQSFTDAAFAELTRELFPDAPSGIEAHQQKVDEKRDDLMHLFAEAETNEFGRGTKYAAYNAFTEYADWFTPVRGEDADGTKRATRSMTSDTIQAFKNNALRAVQMA